MKFNVLTMAAAVSATTFLVSCEQPGGGSASSGKLESDIDSVSYALGINIMSNVSRQGVDNLNGDAMADAVNAFSSGDSSKIKMSDDEAMQYLNKYFSQIQERQREKQGSEQRSEGETFLKENAERSEVNVTESGLQYEVIEEGTGKRPSAEDKVRVHYVGTLLSGKKFDSSIDRGEPAEFPLNGVIPGWTEGLQLMKEGAKYKFYIPYQLAYGERGMGENIPPYATLVFEVELIKIL